MDRVMIGRRLLTARQMRGLGQGQLAAKMGRRYDRSIISKVERGQINMLLDGLIQAAQALEVSTDYLVGLTDDPRPTDERLSDLEPPNSVLIESDWGVAGISSDVYPVEENGLAFSWSWLNENRIQPERSRVYQVNGHLMHPTIYSGDVVLVDYERTRLIDGSVYLVKQSDSVTIGRARFSGGEWHLFNRASGRMRSEATLGKEREVRGQVCWIGRSLLRLVERSKLMEVPHENMS